MARLYGMAACLLSSSAAAAHFSSVAGKFECPDIGNSLNCAVSIEKSLHAPFLHRLSAVRLDVDLMDGRIHSFTGVDAEDGTALYYNALETSLANRYVVIQRQFHEGSGYGLLDRKSGAFTTFKGYPVFSPDGHWLAVADGGEDDPGVLQIFDVAGGTFRLVFDASPARWWPEKVAWRSSTILGYEHATLAELPSVEVKTVRAKLTYNGGVWR